MVSDKFYIDHDAHSVDWLYYNPDSFAGGQYVCGRLTADDIEKAALSGNINFYDRLEESCKQYLIDIDAADFAVTNDYFRNAPCDFKECTDETMDALIALAAEWAREDEAVNENNDDYEEDCDL